MSPPEPFSLAQLEALRPADLDPQVWAENRAALQADQPGLAAALEGVTLPPHWQPARALDGTTTFRCELPGQPARWLADTAVPRARAEGLLAGLAGDQNVALPAIAAGGELALLLERLPDYTAVYVFEPELTALAAVLRFLPLGPAIRAGRCLLMAPSEPAAVLARVLHERPGLLPPAQIVCLPGAPAERVAELRRLCEQAGQTALTGRAERLARLRAARDAAKPGAAEHRPAVEPESAAPAAGPALAILALTPELQTRRASRALHAAAGELGWRSVRCAVDGPADVHLLPHAEAVAGLQPDLVLAIGHPPGRLPIALPGAAMQWLTDASEVPAELPAGVLHLAASPRIADRVRAAACGAGPVADWFWACAPARGPAAAGGPGAEAQAVILVADLPDDQPAACGIEQPSHRQLWKALRQRIQQRWTSADVLDPAALLAWAEGATGLRVGEPALRARLVSALTRALIPAVVVETIVQACRAGPWQVRALGRGWQREPGKEIASSGPCIFELPECGGGSPRAAIFGGALDPLSPALLQAAALGWPLLLHDPGGRLLARGLGGVLQRDQHYVAFTGAADLRAALEAWQADPAAARARADRARAHVLSRHTFAQRLRALPELAARAFSSRRG